MDQLEEGTRRAGGWREKGLSASELDMKLKVGEMGDWRGGMDLNLDMEIRGEQLPSSLRRSVEIRSGWPEGRTGHTPLLAN